MEEGEIIALLLRREQAGITAAAEKYSGSLKRLALRFVHDEGAAEECVQDALLDAWNSIPPNEPHGYLFAYLGRLTRCRALDRLEHDHAAKRSAEFVELTREMEQLIPSRSDAAAEAEAAELMRLVNAFLAKLPKYKRDIFVRRYWYLDPVAEIAKLTGSGESRVKMILLRTRDKLRQYLAEHGYKV